MSAIFLFVDSIAMLDMLCSFADVVAFSQASQPYVRPNIVSNGTLSIRGGSHPMFSAIHSKGKFGLDGVAFISNDCYISPESSFVVITGPNGSGKSTYIKQTALIVILAQIGCFVPAVQATIPIRDRILSRIGTSDDMENNISTFSMEMKETAYIIEHANENSLVVIDELGRGTSNLDGISLAFSISEELIHLKAACLFVTHYPQVISMS